MKRKCFWPWLISFVWLFSIVNYQMSLERDGRAMFQIWDGWPIKTDSAQKEELDRWHESAFDLGHWKGCRSWEPQWLSVENEMWKKRGNVFLFLQLWHIMTISNIGLKKYHYHSLASHAKRMCSNIFCTDPSESGLCEGGADRSIRRDRQVETSLVTGEADTCTTTRGEPQRQGWQKYFLKVHVQKNRWKPVWSQLRQTCTRGRVSGDKVPFKKTQFDQRAC